MKGVFLMDEKFINYMKENGLSENTSMGYARDVKLFKQYYIDSYGEELKKIIHADISMYSNYLFRQNISPITINRKLAAIKQFNLFLIAEGIQEDIAILDKDYCKIQNSIISKTLPSEQVINKLKHYSSIDSKRDYCVIILRLIDIMLEERFINVIGKGHKLRQVIINNIMYDALKEYIEERKQIKTENQYLFIGKKTVNNKNHLNRNFCNRLLDKYKDVCKIDRLFPHLLRAYFCTNALHNAGYSIDQVANQARS